MPGHLFKKLKELVNGDLNFSVGDHPKEMIERNWPLEPAEIDALDKKLTAEVEAASDSQTGNPRTRDRWKHVRASFDQVKGGRDKEG
ncbi:MAG TPA: hypothetical protein VGR91_03265 [Stellaceae bacterium]|nr:hypothetical protein [Stellaceae bacterium]